MAAIFSRNLSHQTSQIIDDLIHPKSTLFSGIMPIFTAPLKGSKLLFSD